jgi:hypothetical protein
VEALRVIRPALSFDAAKNQESGHHAFACRDHAAVTAL